MTNEPFIGVAPGLSYEQYAALPGISRSRLWTLYAKTPKRFKWETDHPAEVEGKALRDGIAIHAMLLEPERFKDAYIVGGPINPKTEEPYGEKTKKYAAWKAAQTKAVLPQATYDLCLAVSVAVHAHPFLAPLFETMQKEVSLQWVHGETGLLLKTRLDVVNFNGGIIVDLKSTRSAATQLFGHDAYIDGYVFQGGMYTVGFEAATQRKCQEYILAAMEKEPPYDIQCFRLTEAQLDHGRAQVTDALRQLVLCRQYDDWPGYPEGLQELMLPGWAGQEWSPYADGLEQILRTRAEKAGRELPPETADADDGEGNELNLV